MKSKKSIIMLIVVSVLIAFSLLMIFIYRKTIFQCGNPIPYIQQMIKLENGKAYGKVHEDTYITKKNVFDDFEEYIEESYNVEFSEKTGINYIYSSNEQEITLTPETYWSKYEVWKVTCEEKEDGQLSLQEKLEDFNYMYEVIKEAHPFLEVNKRVYDVDWVANKTLYEDMIKSTTNDQDFINKMQYILSKLNNRHSHLIVNEVFNIFRECDKDFGWYDFWDNPNVIKRYGLETESSSDSNYFNKIGGVILNDIVDGEIGYMHLPEMVIFEEDIEKDLVIIEEYLKGLDDYEALVIDIRGNPGGNDLYWESIVSMLIDEDMERPGYVLFRSGDVVDKYLKNTGHEVRDINELIDLELEHMPKEVATDFNSYFKHNGIIESNKVSNFNGEIYLLIDKAVFSSSESFAIFAKDSGFATLIGEVTRGDGGGVAPILFDLPNSGIVIRMPSNMYLTSSGECNQEVKTTPDYIITDPKIGNISTDFSEDRCIPKVLELESLRKN